MSESGSGAVRCLLANAMGSKRKDLTLERHILRTQTCDPDKLVSEATVTDVWNAVNGNKVAEALAALRRGRASREPLADMVVRAALCC